MNRSGCFELLGAPLDGLNDFGVPVGSSAYCDAFTRSTRLGRAQACLDALADLPDAQTALLLLRFCGGFTKVVHASRVTPPDTHLDALRAYDDAVRCCLERLGGFQLSAAAWEQAGLSVRRGGLGLRSAARHCFAAYLASLSAAAGRCQELDPDFQPTWASFGQAFDAYNACLEPADRLPSPAPPNLRQQSLSLALDKASLARLTATASGEAARAHLQLLQQPGAGAWLNACPSEALGLHVETQQFCLLLRLRLRLPVASQDWFCPFCDAVADSFGDHARLCACGGDRTKRHNRLRNLLASRAAAAGLSPELEKAGLLPQRPVLAGVGEDGKRTCNGRRPADVWVPAWGLHGPAAFDLAVTCGLRGGELAHSAADGAHAATAYEARKRAHQDTEASCRREGLQFIPLVAEGCAGGWGPTATATWRSLGRLLAAQSGEPVASTTEHLLQALSVVLQRENARAVLRRLPASGLTPGSLPEP